MFLSRLLSASPRLLENRSRVLYKNKWEAAKDFWKVSGANILFHVGIAVVVLEFGFPTPDVVHDLKKMISPDFALFSQHGNLAEFQLDLSNKIRGLRAERTLLEQQQMYKKSPGAKIGGLA